MNLEAIKSELEAAVTGCRLELVANPSPSGQHSLRIDAAHAVALALCLRDAPGLRFDFCSNVTGIDWPGKQTTEKVKAPQAHRRHRAGRRGAARNRHLPAPSKSSITSTRSKKSTAPSCFA